MKVRSPIVYTAMMSAKTRLRATPSWFPIPCLISFFLVLLLTAHVALSTNPRTGQPAAVLPLAAEKGEDSAIWFSMVIEKDKVVVIDNYRKVFKWPVNTESVEDLEPFINHLKKRVATEVESAALAERISNSQVRAIIAVDQTLRYRHFRPILFALAEAGISQYGFETIDVSHKSDLSNAERKTSKAGI